MPLITDPTTTALPGYLKQDEKDLIETAVKVGWKLHIAGGTSVTLIAPPPHENKKIHLGRRSSIPLKRMRTDVIKYADPQTVGATIMAQTTHTTSTTRARRTRSNGQADPTTAVDTIKAAATITAPGTRVTATWETITPALAAELLAVNVGNRRVSIPHVHRIAKDMLEGRYQVTHQGVALSDDGVLLDGQHRLMAIVESDTTQILLVTRGLPPVTQTTMDGGKKRQVQDFLDGSHVAMRQSAARLVLAAHAVDELTILNIGQALRDLTTSEVLSNTSPDLDETLQLLAPAVSSAAMNINIMGPSPLLAATALVIPDMDEAVEYLSGYTSLTGMTPGDPRAALVKVRGTTGLRVAQPTAFAYALRAAYAYITNRQLRILRSIPITSVILDLNQIERQQQN